MIQGKKIFGKKIVLLSSCLAMLFLTMWNQHTYKNMDPFPIVLENEQGMIIYRDHVIIEQGDFFCFIIPNDKEYKVWVQVNKGQYQEVNSGKVEINMLKVKKYKKEIFISFLREDNITGKKKRQTYIFSGTDEDKERICIESKRK